jgi:hypothetical protein
MPIIGREAVMVNIQAPVLCECIDTRIGTISTAGGVKPVFIMQLHNETIDEPLIKYFNCNLSNAGYYSVPHNSDFAKIYRTTIGTNPTKRFSKSHQLISHLSGFWFVASFERAHLRNRKHYLKVTHIKPNAPVRNDAWTLDGSLKKAVRNLPFQTNKNGDEMVTSRRQSGETMTMDWRRSGDSEMLEAYKSLGLEAVFHPTKKRPDQGKITNTLDHVCDADLFVNLTDTAQGFYNERLNVLLKNFGFESPEAESIAMRDVEIKFGQTAFLLKPVSLQTHDEWLAAFNGMEQAT